MKNIHLLPTDKPSRIYSFYGILFTIVNEEIAKINLYKDLKDYQEKLIKAGWKAQNIYITNDEEIKEGDWFLTDDKRVEKCAPDWRAREWHRKIILTTDQDLIKDGVQAIDDEFLEWFVKNPSCEEVKIESWQTKGEWDLDYKIIIPKEEPKDVILGYKTSLDAQMLDKIEPKQETLEKVAFRLYPRLINDPYNPKEDDNKEYRDIWIEGAKWQQERMYSEEEVIAIVEKSKTTGLTAEYLLLTEQFKKK